MIRLPYLLNSKVLLGCMIAAGLSGCGGGSGSGSESSTSQDAKLTLGLTDGPVELADAVVVTFSSVEIQGPERKTFTFAEEKTINLLEYQGSEQILLLEDEVVPVGEYQWIRLGVVDDPAKTYIEIAGQQFPLEIPSAAQTGLKLNRGFTLAAGGVADFTIDFDLRKSVHQQGNGDYKLRPTLRIIDNLEAGSITGAVPESLIINELCNNGDNDDAGNSVYLFRGTDAVLQDVQGNEGDPLASATVSYNQNSLAWEFNLGFVEAGDYTLTFTCDALLDIADEDNSDVVVFSEAVNVTVVANEGASVEFVAPTP